MQITLNGIPISEEQCIGDSLPYINAAFITLKNAIIESSEANNSSYLKVSDFVGFFPSTGGTVFGGVQVGGPGINSGAILRFGKTVNSSDGELIESLPTILCSSSNAIGNDLFINTNSANGKIFLRTGTPSVRTNALVLDSSGNTNIPAGNVCIGSTTIASQKLEVIGGNAKVTSSAAPTLILNNNITNSQQWNSKVQFASNNTTKYELGVDPTATGTNQFYIYDSAATANRLIIRNDGRVYIPGNVGIGTEPVSNRTLKVAGDLEVGGALSILGSFSTAGINALGPIVGTTGTFSGKLRTTSLEGIESAGPIVGAAITGTSYTGGPINGTTGTFTGKVLTSNLESIGPIVGAAITGTSYTGGPISGTTGTFSGKVITSTLESYGPIIGTTGTYSGKVATSNLESSGPVSGTSGTFSGKVTTSNLESSGPVSGTNGTFTGTVTTTNLIVNGTLTGTSFVGTGYSGGPVSGTTGTFSQKLKTTSVEGIESSGPITGTSYTGGPISGTTGTFSGKVTTNDLESSGPVSGTTGTFSGKVTTSNLESSGPVSGTTGTFSNNLVGQGNLSLASNLTAADVVARGNIQGQNIVISGNNIVSGYTTISSYLTAGETRVATLSVVGRTSVNHCAGSTLVFEQGTFTTGISSDLFYAGATQLHSTLSVQGNTNINNNLTVTGNISANGDIIGFQTSDERLKKNITPISNALDKVSNIRGCQFEWNEELAGPHLRGKSAGVIAQEVESVFPEAVTTREDGYKAVRYEFMIPLLFEAVKDLQDQIDKLKEENYNLNEKLNKL